MTVQSQDVEHGGKPPEGPAQEHKGTREGRRDERDKGSAAPKDRGEGTYSGNNTPSRPD
jgi:hypothetical protein